MSVLGPKVGAALAIISAFGVVKSAPAQISELSAADQARFLRQIGQHPPVYPVVIQRLAGGDFAALRGDRTSPGRWRASIAANEGHIMPGWMVDAFAVLRGVAETTWWRQTSSDFWGTPDHGVKVVSTLMPPDNATLLVLADAALKHDLHYFAGIALGEHAMHSADEAKFAERVMKNARDALIQGVAEFEKARSDKWAKEAAANDPSTAWWRHAIGTWRGTFDGPHGPERMELVFLGPGSWTLTLADRRATTNELEVQMRIVPPEGATVVWHRFPVSAEQRATVDIMFDGSLSETTGEMRGGFGPSILPRRPGQRTARVFGDLEALTTYEFRLKRVTSESDSVGTSRPDTGSFLPYREPNDKEAALWRTLTGRWTGTIEGPAGCGNVPGGCGSQRIEIVFHPLDEYRGQAPAILRLPDLGAETTALRIGVRARQAEFAGTNELPWAPGYLVEIDGSLFDNLSYIGGTLEISNASFAGLRGNSRYSLQLNRSP
jgi:hypothetical protein